MALISYFHFSFTVSDLERSIAFYRDQMGLRLVHRMVHDQKYTSSQIGFKDALLKVALFNVADMPQGASPSGHVLELIEYVNPRGEPLNAATNQPGAAHLALQVDDLEAEFARLKAAGVQFRSDAPVPITHGRHSGGLTCYLLDPDGITLELIELPVPFTPQDLD
ncbi:MAG: VOC family protein [Anaerolineaceae bacterium]|nr:VOC family protein [Anaerolineaceae bacterium]MCY4021868.1 VOC family protein [Anaerolineaceae bacterium]